MGKPREEVLGREHSVLSPMRGACSAVTAGTMRGDALGGPKAIYQAERPRGHWQLTVGGAEPSFIHSFTHSQLFVTVLSVTSTVLGTADTLGIKTSSSSRTSAGQTLQMGSITSFPEAPGPQYSMLGCVEMLENILSSSVQAAVTRYHRLGGLDTANAYFLQFWSLGGPGSRHRQIQRLGRASRFREGAASLPAQGVWWVSFIRALSPFVRAEPSGPYHLQRPRLQI